MQFSIIALTLLISSAAAHMIMADPPQWAVPGESLGPLDPTGADFPCANGVADPVASRTFTPGSTAKLQVQGSAVHGGGSGQMLITYDFPPTKNSVWRVMQSFEGDHPFKAAGNLPPNPYLVHTPMDWNVPTGLPAGRAVVAWSWFNRIGNREMYMKCATVQIAGQKSSVSDLNNDPGMLALPTLFRANSGNGCNVPEGVDAIAFKNPGPNPIIAGGYTGTVIPCDDSLPGSGSGSGSPKPTTTGITDASMPTTKIAAGVPAPTTTGHRSGSDRESGNGNGNELPGISVAVPTTTTKVKVDKTTFTTLTKTMTYPSNIAKPDSTKAADTGAGCPEGKVYCNPDNTWSMCGSGYIQKIGPVPTGMQCVNGEFSAKVRRAAEFAGSQHVRRRHHGRH